MANALLSHPYELERVLVWRFERLRDAGYSEDQAIDLAAEPSVDLHRALELLERGCPPELALAILV